MSWKARVVCLTCGLVLTLQAAAGAQEKELPQYSDSMYNTLAAADSKDTVAPGTKITLANWRQYQQFLPIGMRLMLEGKSVFKYPADFEMDVGPTTPLPLPKKFRDDTEKYNRQVTLTQLSSGGYTIAGYAAGAPFPDPSGPTAGTELMYDNTTLINPIWARLRSPEAGPSIIS